jgi:hypothetical protein
MCRLLTQSYTSVTDAYFNATEPITALGAPLAQDRDASRAQSIDIAIDRAEASASFGAPVGYFSGL